MKVFCISQARMGSTRLPGKILSLVNGKSLLQWHCERIQQSKKINRHIIATTTNPQDQALVSAFKHFFQLSFVNNARNKSIEFYCGDEHNVLLRYLATAKHFNLQPDDLIVRLTSDCPLVDPTLIDQLIKQHIAQNINGISNIDINSYARGFDAEVFSMAALCQAAANADTEYQREHVTPYFYQHPEQYPLLSLKLSAHETLQLNAEQTDATPLRLCVDESDDLALITALMAQFPEDIIDASAAEIMHFLKQNPEIAKINRHVIQKSHIS